MNQNIPSLPQSAQHAPFLVTVAKAIKMLHLLAQLNLNPNVFLHSNFYLNLHPLHSIESKPFAFDPTYAEITELQLLRGLTTKVIKVKHGYFPKDGSERSGACKDGTWEYMRSQDGSTTIKYNGRIELPRTPRDQFPSTFTVKNRLGGDLA